MKFEKPAISVADQIALLKSRGLIIGDEELAAHYLINISYYRLAGYWWPMQADKVDHIFKKGSQFSTVINLYDFDRELRLIVLNAIERIEIGVRTRLIYEFSMKYDPWWFQEENLFRNNHHFHKNLKSINREWQQSNEVFIKDHNKKYNKDSRMPPAWKSLEIISMGTLSKLYMNMKLRKDKNYIARTLNLPNHRFLESWLRCISEVRNICAHHNRLWNRNLVSIPDWLDERIEGWTDGYQPEEKKKRKVYSTICAMQFLLNVISPGNSFKSRYESLFEKYPDADPAAMGFPADWRQQSIWKN